MSFNLLKNFKRDVRTYLRPNDFALENPLRLDIFEEEEERKKTRSELAERLLEKIKARGAPPPLPPPGGGGEGGEEGEETEEEKKEEKKEEKEGKKEQKEEKKEEKPPDEAKRIEQIQKDLDIFKNDLDEEQIKEIKELATDKTVNSIEQELRASLHNLRIVGAVHKWDGKSLDGAPEQVLKAAAHVKNAFHEVLGNAKIIKAAKDIDAYEDLVIEEFRKKFELGSNKSTYMPYLLDYLNKHGAFENSYHTLKSEYVKFGEPEYDAKYREVFLQGQVRKWMSDIAFIAQPEAIVSISTILNPPAWLKFPTSEGSQPL